MKKIIITEENIEELEILRNLFDDEKIDWWKKVFSKIGYSNRSVFFSSLEWLNYRLREHKMSMSYDCHTTTDGKLTRLTKLILTIY